MLRPRLLAPLGLPDIPWHRDPLGRELGFTGSHLTTEAIASLAQLYLDGGRWEGRQLLPEAWVEEATRAFGPRDEDPNADEDWRRGYGYSFWMQRFGYRGDGAYGQFLVVLPDHDTVVAITAEQWRMQSTLDGLWEHLVPALGGAGPTRPTTSWPSDSRSRDPGLGRRRAGAGPRRVHPLVASDLSDDYTAVSVTRDGRRTARAEPAGGVAAGAGGGSGARCERALVGGGATLPVVSSGGWVDDDIFQAEVIAIESPHRFRVEARFAAGMPT